MLLALLLLHYKSSLEQSSLPLPIPPIPLLILLLFLFLLSPSLFPSSSYSSSSNCLLPSFSPFPPPTTQRSLIHGFWRDTHDNHAPQLYTMLFKFAFISSNLFFYVLFCFVLFSLWLHVAAVRVSFESSLSFITFILYSVCFFLSVFLLYYFSIYFFLTFFSSSSILFSLLPSPFFFHLFSREI